MNSYANTVELYSSALSEQRRLMIFTLFASLCIGGFIGLQLDQYLDIMCVERGTCYGMDEGFVFNASLIHPMVIKLFLSSIILIAASAAIKSLVPFSSLKSVGIISENDIDQIKQLYTVLLFTGSIFLLLSLPLMFYSLLV